MKTRIRKAVFPVGGLGTRFYPITRAIPKEMIGIIDKPLIHYACEEALNAGIEQFIFVTRHGKNAIEDYFDYASSNFHGFDLSRCSFCYVRQSEPLGLGHAVLCAKSLISEEPFAVISADDFIHHNRSCIGEMIEHYDGANMAAVMTVPWEEVNRYGILDVESENDRIVFARSLHEKPQQHQAKSNHAIVGRYILSHEIFDVLQKLSPGINGEIQLTDALLKMIPILGFSGFKFHGCRFDCGTKEGLLDAMMHVAYEDGELRQILDRHINKHYKKNCSNHNDGNGEVS